MSKHYLQLILLFLAFWSYGLRAEAQSVELSSFIFPDTAAINEQIDAATQIASKYPDSAKAMFSLAAAQSRSSYKQGAQTALYRLAALYYREGNYGTALHYFAETIKKCDPLKDSVMLIRTYNNVANIFIKQLKLERAMEASNTATTYGTASPKDLAMTYCNMGTVLKMLSQPERAQYYYDKALPIAIQTHDTTSWCGILMNKGMCFNDEKQYDKSAFFLDSAIVLARQQHLYKEWAIAAVAISNLHLAKSEPRKALLALQSPLSWENKNTLSSKEKNMLLIQAGTVHLKLNQYTLAERYLKQALNTTQENQYHYMMTVSKLHELSAAIQDYSRAYAYLKELYVFQDSLGNKEVAMQVNELETKYRSAEKDKTIAENQLRMSVQENRLARQRNWIGGVVSGSLLLLMLLSWRYSHVRQKHKRLESQMEIEQLKAAMEGEQKERARIASELHDGIVAELTAIKMNLEASSNRLLSLPDSYQQNLKELSTVINDVRNTAHNLMPEILLRHGLAEALGLLCESIVKTGRLSIDYQQYGDYTALDMDTRQQIYRIAQELLHNIIKHARAQHALLQASCHKGLLTINLEDDGIGMDRQKNDGNMGIASIEQRVSRLKGKIEWTTTKEGGTQVYLEFDV